MAERIILFWRDIPAQVIVKKSRREQAKEILPERFEKAIDMAAMRGGARDTDTYLQEWRRGTPEECGEDLQAEAQKKAQALDKEYDNDRLKALINNGGHEPS